MTRGAVPPLSIVAATTQGWPEVRPWLEHIRPQAEALQAELIVADGSGRALPDATALGGCVTWLSHPGKSVFDLRAEATRMARGEVVAVTEDHCFVGPDWCARLVEAHARRPDAVAVKGVVLNGTAERLVDRAAFLLNQAPHLPPFRGRAADAVLGVSCVAYKRRALERLAAAGERWPELRDHRAWLATGDHLVADEGPWVEHRQSMPLLQFAALQFHNARAVSGLRRRRLTGRDWTRMLALPLLPFVRTVRTAVLCLTKAVPGMTVATSLPLIFGFYCWKGAGELVGYLTGPGRSPHKLV